MNVGEVDCTSDGGKPICKDMGVKGYPTLIYFPPSTAVDGQSKMCRYKGSRALDSFKSYDSEMLWKSADCEALPGAVVISEEL